MNEAAARQKKHKALDTVTVFNNTPILAYLTGDTIIKTIEQQRFDFLYEQHLINLKLQGKRPATIDAYSRAIRRITTYFDRTPDTLTIYDGVAHAQ